jgi:glycosyltransferase involved in cell wall biosynthesis
LFKSSADSAVRNASSYGSDVRILDYVPGEDLALFYSSASVFIFPSLYEGFGLTVLEAMSCGCPVIIGHKTACEEIAGNAGIAVDPKNARAIADATQSLLTNHELAARHGELGLRRAEQFTWKKAAEETRSVYQRLAGV